MEQETTEDYKLTRRDYQELPAKQKAALWTLHYVLHSWGCEANGCAVCRALSTPNKGK